MFLFKPYEGSMDFLYFLLGSIVLSSILGPVAGRYVSPRPRVSNVILAALVTPAILLVAAAYLSSLDSAGEPEKLVAFGVFFAIVSLLIGLVTAPIVLLIKPGRFDSSGQQSVAQIEGLRTRMLLWGWAASVVALLATILSVFA